MPIKMGIASQAHKVLANSVDVSNGNDVAIYTVTEDGPAVFGTDNWETITQSLVDHGRGSLADRRQEKDVGPRQV